MRPPFPDGGCFFISLFPLLTMGTLNAAEVKTSDFNVDPWLNVYWDEFRRNMRTETRLQVTDVLAQALGRPSMEGETVVVDRVKRTITSARGTVLETIPEDLLALDEGAVYFGRITASDQCGRGRFFLRDSWLQQSRSA